MGLSLRYTICSKPVLYPIIINNVTEPTPQAVGFIAALTSCNPENNTLSCRRLMFFKLESIGRRRHCLCSPLQEPRHPHCCKKCLTLYICIPSTRIEHTPPPPNTTKYAYTKQSISGAYASYGAAGAAQRAPPLDTPQSTIAGSCITNPCLGHSAMPLLNNDAAPRFTITTCRNRRHAVEHGRLL